MSLKSVAGVLLLTDDMDLRATPYKAGHYLSFNAVSQERRREGPPVLHYYKVSMFVPQEEKGRWKAQLVPGKVLFVQNGTWSARKTGDYAYPINDLRLNRNDVTFLLNVKEKKE